MYISSWLIELCPREEPLSCSWAVSDDCTNAMCARRFFIGGVEALALLNVWRMLRKSRPLWVTVRNAVLFNAVWMVYGFIHRAIIARRIWRAHLTLECH